MGNNVGQGSAYVFVRTGAAWTEQAHLTAVGGTSHDIFGTVAISGDTIVVGAEQDQVGGNRNQGSAYVFTRSGTTWTQQARLNGAESVANEMFGVSVAISEDRCAQEINDVFSRLRIGSMSKGKTKQVVEHATPPGSRCYLCLVVQ